MFRFSRLLYPLLILFTTFVFFYPVFFKNLLPIPADTIVGLYHPYRDLYVNDYPRGIPFKNFLITDPVRQQYPWKSFAVEGYKNKSLAIWNPYSFSGTPHLANIQSGVFYPFNLLHLVLPFHISWSFYILSQPLLAGIFTFLYLKNQKLNEKAAFLGALTFSFGGFSIAWLEWGNIISTALWLPLILLATDKLVDLTKTKKTIFAWWTVLTSSLVVSFFAGHWQTFFYITVVFFLYFIAGWFRSGKKTSYSLIFVGSLIVFGLLTAVQWVPSLNFILLSARDLDKISFNTAGWFIPWQHLVQFIVPDFFGNPTTLNYWGEWNYAEFVGYSGIFPLAMAIGALIFVKSRQTVFFGSLLLISLIFSLPTFIAKLPYALDIPFIASSQPTRLLFIACFSISVLSAYGFDYFLKKKNVMSIAPFVLVGALLILSFAWAYFTNIDPQNLAVVKRNMIFPVGILLATFFSSLGIQKLKNQKLEKLLIPLLIIITVFDLFRFGWKFTPFTKQDYLYPESKSLEFLKKNVGNFRVMTTDSRILPPNFSVIHKIPSIEGYDPLFIQRYAEFIVAVQRGRPDISPPFNFNRIITPHDSSSSFIDLLGVKYVLSLDELSLPKLSKVYEEGQTKIYRNERVVPRAFLAQDVISVADKNEAIRILMESDFDFRRQAVVEGFYKEGKMGSGSAKIKEYSENRILIDVELEADGFLVLTDVYYASWKAKIDGKDDASIYPTDFTFRGVAVPKGKHKIEFYVNLL